MVEISTSILNVDKENAMKTFYDLEVAKTDYYHIDVMDGKFVEKNTTELMYDYANSIKHISNIPLDVHLMVENVQEYIEQYLELKPHFITIHYEAFKDKKEIKKTLQYLKKNDIQCGLSIKPKTKIEEIYEFLPQLSLFLMMTVEPGKGGQKLIPETIEKIRKLKEYIYQNNLETFIEADGGINTENVAILKDAGVDIMVVGSCIINSDDYKKTIKELKK
jgi:ribulose-phosphate 3-epimerase